MEKLLKSSCISLGITMMDNAHKILTKELVAILQSPDHEFTRRFQRFCHLLEQSFQQEENLMEEISYYDLRAHREQHATLLGTLHHAIPRAMDGDYFFPREILSLLPQWFLAHLVKMDAALIKALETAGAKPVPPSPPSPPSMRPHSVSLAGVSAEARMTHGTARYDG